MAIITHMRVFGLVSLAAVALAACTPTDNGGAGSSAASSASVVQPPPAAIPLWTVSGLTATRTAQLAGVGSAAMVATCTHGPNDFSISIDATLSKTDGSVLKLDPAILNGATATAYLKTVRSTGEEGSVIIDVPTGSHFIYSAAGETTAKVEVPQQIELQVVGGAKPMLEILTNDTGFQSMLTNCQA